jgi:CYTH domain-containing protein
MSDAANLINPSAPPGKHQKYARPERERRFLLAGLPLGEIEQTATIVDRYLLGTRLRLRRTVEIGAHGTRTVHKLTQKVPAPDGGPGLITTVYLSEEEHERLSTIPAAILRKTRFSIEPFGVDQFAPPLDGLFLAEIEFDTDEAMQRFTAPSWAVSEVTRDPRFTGGHFAMLATGELTALLQLFGVHRRV